MPVADENGITVFDTDGMQGFVAVDELSAMTLGGGELGTPVPQKPPKPIVGIIFPPPEVRSKFFLAMLL
jgi:hypothetical protein